MLNTHGRKIYRDIVTRKTRTLLVCASIFVGVLGVVILVTMGQLVTRQLDRDLKLNEMAMLRLYVSVPADATVDNAAALDLLRSQPDVTAVEGQAVYQYAWKLPNETTYREGQLFAYSQPFGRIELEPIRLIRGDYPEADLREIAIERRMADEYDLDVGDTLDLRTYNGDEESWKIVGIVFQPYIYIGSGDSTTSAYASFSDAQGIAGFKGFSTIYARFESFSDARENSSSFRRALTSQTPYRIGFHLLDNPAQNTFIVGVRRFSNVLTIVAIVAMVVASFLVTNVISTVMSEQRRQIGAMKAIGATRLDLLIIYLGTALVYGLIGMIPAVLIGNPLGQAAARATAPLANIVLDKTQAAPNAILLGIAMGLGIPVLAALIPIYNGTKVTILEAMSDWGIQSHFGRGMLPRLMSRLPLPILFEQAFNNVLMRWRRLTLTLFALTLAAAAFMGIFAVFYNLTSVIGNIRSELNIPVSINPTNLDVGTIVQQIVTADAEPIRSIEPGVAIELNVKTPVAEEDGVADDENASTPDDFQQLIVTGIDTQNDLGYLTLAEGTGWRDNPDQEGIVITPAMAERLQRDVGDTLELVSPQNTRAFPIIGITAFPIETAFMEWQQLAEFVGTIPDAPTPNAFWQPVEIQSETGDAVEVWAVGIDQNLGEALYPDYQVEEPGIIISRALANQGQLAVGDQVEIRAGGLSSVEEILEGVQDILIEEPPPQTFPVLQIVDVGADQVELATDNTPPAVLEGPPEIVAMYWVDLAALVELDNREITPEMFYIDVANPNLEASSTEQPTASTTPIAVYTNELGFADRIAQTIVGMSLVMNFASLLMAIVGGIGLLTIMSISVFERQREIGVMRSVGASSRIILLQFLIEGLLVGLVAWLLAVPLSYYLSQILIDAVPFREVIQFEFTMLAPLVGLAGTLLMTAIATLYPSIVAARKTVSSILRYQ